MNRAALTQTALPILLRAFPGMAAEEAERLLSLSVARTYPAGTVLCHEDQFEHTFYIILEGQVKVTKAVNPAQDEVRLLKVLGSGDFFGEMALIQEAPRAATVTTTQTTTVLEIEKEAFNSLLESSASLTRALMHEVVRRLRENDAMAIEDLRLKAGELAAAYQQLAELEYARRQFVSAIAHELRTPLTAASGFLQLVEIALEQGQTLNDAPLQEAVRVAARHIDQITALVNDLLFAQEMDLILPRFQPLSLTTVVEQAIAQCQSRLEEQEVSLQVSLPNDLPAVMGDASSLARALAAVLDNAIKFSHEQGVVEVGVLAQDEWVRITVRDYGVGIPAEIMPRIFERFFHTDRIGERLFRGVGLGLSIARRVIEQHHGTIEVSSRVGEGTEVRIALRALPEGQGL